MAFKYTNLKPGKRISQANDWLRLLTLHMGQFEGTQGCLQHLSTQFAIRPHRSISGRWWYLRQVSAIQTAWMQHGRGHLRYRCWLPYVKKRRWLQQILPSYTKKSNQTVSNAKENNVRTLLLLSDRHRKRQYISGPSVKPLALWTIS